MRANGVLSTAILAAGALIAGCSSGPPRDTTADLTRAQTLVSEAQSSGAQQYAAADLQSARDKVQQAGQLANHDSQRADRLANEASVDAQLASARAQNAKAQHALDEMNRTLESLRQESERNTNRPGAPPAAEPNTPPESAPAPESPKD
ncbi:MAG TPA: DUF4398 domain-containing protein [Steroidobacteraceae bacterium]